LRVKLFEIWSRQKCCAKKSYFVKILWNQLTSRLLKTIFADVIIPLLPCEEGVFDNGNCSFDISLSLSYINQTAEEKCDFAASVKSGKI